MKTAEQILHKYFHHFQSERTRNLIVKAMEEYRLQPPASPVMSAEQVDWESFRDKFFKQCTHNDSMDGCMINTNIEPSALFEWFKHNLPVYTTPSVKAERQVNVEEVERLQSEIHKITGDGEVMMLFNKLLGNSAAPLNVKTKK